MAHDAPGHGDHQPHFSAQWIFIALCICTALSVIFDLVDWNRRLIAVLVMAIAVAKAQFVMRYFMHLKFEGRWKYVLLLPTVILACGLPLALAPDIALHYYTPERESVEVAAHGADAHEDHAAGDETDGHAHDPADDPADEHAEGGEAE